MKRGVAEKRETAAISLRPDRQVARAERVTHCFDYFVPRFFFRPHNADFDPSLFPLKLTPFERAFTGSRYELRE